MRSSTARPAARTCSTSAGISSNGREGRFDTGLVVASEERNRPAKLLHAEPAQLLGCAQRVLGGGEVTVQHVTCARHLEHHCGEPVPHKVVDVTRDLTPLGEQRLLGELAPCRYELLRKLTVTRQGAAGEPRKAVPMIQIATATSDGRGPEPPRRVWPRSAGRGTAAAGSCDQRDDESQQDRLEHEQLEPTRALRDHHGHDHAESCCRERYAPRVRP